ncbi:hypothetical protein P9074_11325 [Gallibacterium anatis]|uniref:hypothetical protein n=1 Tax=Gallibacterium anatis TaxID=750 RepID=UPI0012D2FC52|nr:hypothetical protein [Gallibacterium anatis]
MKEEEYSKKVEETVLSNIEYFLSLAKTKDELVAENKSRLDFYQSLSKKIA